MGTDMRNDGNSNRAEAWRPVLQHNAPEFPTQQPRATPDRRWQLMPPRPQWSLKTSFLTALLLLAVITPLVFLVVHRTLWLELEAVTAVVAVLMFFYLALVLHLGVRFDRNERFTVAWFSGSPGTLLDVTSLTPDFGFVTLGSDLGPLGCLVGLIVDVLFSVALAALLFLRRGRKGKLTKSK